jgi:PadR family transcriptional regulator PadR
LNERYLKQFKKGILEIIVLKLLSVHEMYGYELISSLNSKSRFFNIKEGTLYPILYRLEDEQLMETRWEQSETRGVPKKYYIITEKGRLELQSAKKLWLDFSSDVEKILNEKEAVI